LKTKDDSIAQNLRMREMKTQMLDYMSGSKLADFRMDESNKILVAVETPIRLTLIEAIRVKFTQDGSDPRTIDDWLKEVKEIRRTGVKSTRKVMKISKIRKQKEQTERKAAKAAKGAKGTKGKSKDEAPQTSRKGRVRIENNKENEADVPERGAPMRVEETKSA